MFFCEFCKISKNTFSYRTPLVVASFIRYVWQYPKQPSPTLGFPLWAAFLTWGLKILSNFSFWFRFSLWWMYLQEFAACCGNEDANDKIPVKRYRLTFFYYYSAIFQLCHISILPYFVHIRSLKELIKGDSDVVMIAETKMDASSTTAQFLLGNYISLSDWI